MAYNVKNIESELAYLKAQGFELIDEKSKPGFGGHGGYLIAFIQSKLYGHSVGTGGRTV